MAAVKMKSLSILFRKTNAMKLICCFSSTLVKPSKLYVGASEPKSIESVLKAVSFEGKFSQTPFPVLRERLQILQKFGICTDEIIKNPKLLLVTSGKLRGCIETLKELNIDLDALPEILPYNNTVFKKFLAQCHRDLTKGPEHRIQYMSKALSVSHADICRLIAKYNFILSLSFTQLSNAIQTLLQFKVLPEDILRDPWILRSKPEIITFRLKRVEEVDVSNVKPWMARCTEEVFNGFLSRVSSKQKLLGELSLEEYLSERLGCSASDMNKLINREPQLQKTSVLKMKRILDFLFASGFEANHIISGLPRVANRRIETIHSRLLELNQAGIPPNLYVLCKSKKEYTSYVQKWKNRLN